MYVLPPLMLVCIKKIPLLQYTYAHACLCNDTHFACGNSGRLQELQSGL